MSFVQKSVVKKWKEWVSFKRVELKNGKRNQIETFWFHSPGQNKKEYGDPYSGPIYENIQDYIKKKNHNICVGIQTKITI